VLNGDMEAWDDANTPASWTKAENLTQETTTVHGGTSSAKQTHDGTKDIMQEIAVQPGRTYEVTYYYLDNDPNARSRMWGGFRDASGWIGDNSAFQPSSYSTDDANWVVFSETAVAPAGVEVFRFEVRTYNEGAGGGSVYYDDFSLIDVTPVDPIVEISSPADDFVTTSNNIEIDFLVTNFDVATAGNGDGHIHWYIDGNMTMKYDVDPIQLTGLTTGMHQFIIKLVDDAHQDITPMVADTLNFEVLDNDGPNIVFNGDVESWTDATTLDAWTKAENVEQEMTIVHGGTYSVKQTHDGTKDLMQDITVVPGHAYEVKFYLYDNDPNARARMWGGFRDGSSWSGDNSAFQPSSYSVDQEGWVEFSAVAIAPAEADTFRLEVRTYNEGAGGGSIYFDDFSIVDLTTVGIRPVAQAQVSIYPNPANNTITVNANQLETVEIMDINGKTVKRVANADVNQSIDVSNLQQGIYFVKTKSQSGIKVSKLIKL
jgi:hypothetical protein